MMTARNTTPQAAQRNVKGAPDATRPASLATLPQRTPTHAVQGPPAIGNGRAMLVPSGPPPLHAPAAASARPPEQSSTGMNPNPPARRSRSGAADAPPMASGCIIGPYSGLDC